MQKLYYFIPRKRFIKVWYLISVRTPTLQLYIFAYLTLKDVHRNLNKDFSIFTTIRKYAAPDIWCARFLHFIFQPEPGPLILSLSDSAAVLSVWLSVDGKHWYCHSGHVALWYSAGCFANSTVVWFSQLLQDTWTPEQDLDEWMTSVVLVCTCLCLRLSYTKSIIIALVANPLSLMDWDVLHWPEWMLESNLYICTVTSHQTAATRAEWSH